MTALAYRADVDGLRAIAIVSVVLYHVGMPGFPGGFVGVDVFFVISGFLITALLLRELRDTGSVDLLAFWARRARRLLPAFVLVVAATLVLGVLFLVPMEDEQQNLASSAMAAALYAGNVFFALTTGGYWNRPSELMPLLHTWSLAVEEQFYLFWPLALVGCIVAARRWRWDLATVIASVIGLSLLGSLVYSGIAAEEGGRAAQIAFFILPSRAWELAVGAFLALGLSSPAVAKEGGSQPVGAAPWRTLLSSPSTGPALVVLGLFAIGVAVLFFEDGMPFPGFAALLPALGAAAVIAGGALAPGALGARLLATPPMVALGLLSYSWYLWHWPLLAVARAHELGVRDLARDGALALLALGLAWATYAWVENPIRRRRVWGEWGNHRVLAAAAAAALVLIAGAQMLFLYAGHLAGTPHYDRIARAAEDEGWSRARCHHENDLFVSLIPRGDCMKSPASGPKTLVVLWGDSHADHFAAMLERAGNAQGLALLSRTMSGCPPILGVMVVHATTNRQVEVCDRFNAQVLTEIGGAHKRGELAGVVLSARWWKYLGRPELSGNVPRGVVAWPGRRYSREEAPAVLADGLKAQVRSLADRGIKVVVIAPVPEQRFEAPLCLARKTVTHCSIARERTEQHRRVALGAVSVVEAWAPEVRLWDPAPALCGEGRCLVERDGAVIYRDNDHLSAAGARWLAPHFSASAAWLADRAPPIRPPPTNAAVPEDG